LLQQHREVTNHLMWRGMATKIVYTKTDEAPALATYSLLPIIRKFVEKSLMRQAPDAWATGAGAAATTGSTAAGVASTGATGVSIGAATSLIALLSTRRRYRGANGVETGVETSARLEFEIMRRLCTTGALQRQPSKHKLS